MRGMAKFLKPLFYDDATGIVNDNRATYESGRGINNTETWSANLHPVASPQTHSRMRVWTEPIGKDQTVTIMMEH